MNCPPLKPKGDGIRFTIISPTYNHAKYIPQNLESLLGQDYPNFEVIVVNDASTDETHEVLTEFARKDKRIVYHRLEKNKGTMGAFNEGWKLATGDMVYGSASDDYLATPHFLRQVSDAMEKAPQAAGAFGMAEMVSANDGTPMGMLGGIVGHHGYVSAENCWKAFLTHSAIIPGVSCVWRKDLVDLIGGYPEELGPQSDYFVNHALPAMTGVVFLPKKVAVHRMSTKSYNADNTFEKRMRNYAKVEKSFRRLNLHLGINEAVFDAWREHLIESLGAFGYQRNLFKVFRDIEERANPNNIDVWSYLPDDTKKFLESTYSERARLEADLETKKKWAIAEFKKECGLPS